MNNIKVSIIVPVYNSVLTLDKCIKSLINQTYKNIEIILVDDGSNDESGKVCDNYLKEYNIIHVIHKKNEGVSSARNAGINLSKGKYICFVDSDDYVDSKYIEELLKLILKYKTRIGVCKYKRIENDTILYSDESDNEYVISSQKFLEKVLNEDDFGGGVCWNKIFDAKLVKKIMFDEEINVGEDLKFLYSVLKITSNVGITEKKLYISVLRNGSLSKTYKEDDLKKELLICEQIMLELKSSESFTYLISIKRYLRALSYLLIYCENPNNYKKMQKKGKKYLKKIRNFSEIKIKDKIYLYLKIYFPNLYRKIKYLKYKLTGGNV